MFQIAQRSKLFTLLVALELWDFTEKAIYICLSVTISIVTSLRFFSKRDSAQILVLFHSVPHLLFSESWKNSKLPTHLTFNRRNRFSEKIALSRILCNLFSFAFSQIAEISMFFPFKSFSVSMKLFSVTFVKLIHFATFMSIFLIWSSNVLQFIIYCNWQKTSKNAYTGSIYFLPFPKSC